jgi:hypothetical protein
LGKPQPNASAGCSEGDVWKATRVHEPSSEGKIRYTCQATELLNFTQPLRPWDARQYLEDRTSGNASLLEMISCFLYFGFTYGAMAKRRTLGRPSRWVYDKFQSLRNGIPFPRRVGKLGPGEDAPVNILNLKPGDLVRVKSYSKILDTIDAGNKNRGLFFDAEMVPYCGRVFRVRNRVEKFIDEKTGYMRRLKTAAVILEGVYCQSRYSENRLFCPRSIYSWWREIWLEKVTHLPEASPNPTQALKAEKLSRTGKGSIGLNTPSGAPPASPSARLAPPADAPRRRRQD